jgi:hypothetical protein
MDFGVPESQLLAGFFTVRFKKEENSDFRLF